jgi:glutamate synthase domain-containing protein 2
MVTIDLAQTTVRKVNEILRGFGATHQNAEIVNPDAKHYIGVGLVTPIKVIIRGSAGYYCGGLCDGPHFKVDKNVSWGVGDNLLAGSVEVGGNAGAIAGVGMRGGDIVVRGNVGSRAGQVMKKGTLCCAGNANFMAGYMIYGGRVIILGNSGERVGEDMMGGEIYVGGRVDSLGNDAMLVEPSSTDLDSVMEFLDRYDIAFQGSFKKIVCAGKTLRYGTAEPRLRKIPYTVFSSGGAEDYWNAKVQEDIRVKAQIGRYRIRGYGTSRHLPHFQDIAFKADLTGAGMDPDVVTRVNLRTFLGEKHGGRALDLSMPVMIAPMSYGALSKQMKLALGIASRMAGISENSGEGGMLSEERAEARQMIAQCLAGRLGWNVHDVKRADCVEIYISQGAKPGLGGQLMAEKLTKEIAAVRGIPAGMDLRSPSRHPDILGGDDLIMKVEELREATGWRAPISIKLGAGRIRDDIKIALKDGIDFVELDGMQGGTGAAGSEVAEFVGIPTIAGLQEAIDGLAEIDCQGQLPIVLMGGVKDGVDAAKAIALGAAAVACGSSMLIAAGCIACMQCSVGSCVVGAATQDPGHTARFDVEKRALQVYRYLEAIRWQLASIAHAHGYSDIRQLSRNDLVALTPEAAALTRLPYDEALAGKLRGQN